MTGSPPMEKGLRVLEVLCEATTPLSLSEIHSRSKVAKSTLLRILQTFLIRGYAERVGEAYQTRVRIEEKPVGHQEIILKYLTKLQKESGQYSEFLTIREFDFFWEERVENPELALAIRAGKGSLRSVYELDALSRAYLRTFTFEDLKKKFDQYRFRSLSRPGLPLHFDEGKLRWHQIEKILSLPEEKEVCVDIQGNANGIRRYAAALRGRDAGVLGIITIAEAALAPLSGSKHQSHMKSILVKIKDEIYKKIGNNT